ncbi:MAG: hypothetical protein ACI4I2_05575 [Oscillospiraceae bacterium]
MFQRERIQGWDILKYCKAEISLRSGSGEDAFAFVAVDVCRVKARGMMVPFKMGGYKQAMACPVSGQAFLVGKIL